MATQKIPGRAIKLGTDTAGDVAYFDGVAWQRLAIGEVGEILTMNEAEHFQLGVLHGSFKVIIMVMLWVVMKIMHRII